MASNIHLAIDASGGDYGPKHSVPATLDALNDFDSVSVTFFGDENQISSILSSKNASSLDRVNIVHTTEVVEMSEKPSLALRNKQASSMWKAVECVASGHADACVSAGNTGALMAMSCYLLKSFETIQRPAICKPMPTRLGASYLLDLGANIDCSPIQLVQFALMGSSFAKIGGCESPRVALLNVGTEGNKGGKNIQEASLLLSQQSELNYVGFVEGDSIYSGDVDVIVCDGFSGNVALKVSEGVAKFAVQTIQQEVSQSFIRRFLAVPLGWLIKSWWLKYNPSLYNGAALLGLRKTVVKSHGAADKLGFYKAVETAIELVEANIVDRIEHALSCQKA